MKKEIFLLIAISFISIYFSLNMEDWFSDRTVLTSGILINFLLIFTCFFLVKKLYFHAKAYLLISALPLVALSINGLLFVVYLSPK